MEKKEIEKCEICGVELTEENHSDERQKRCDDCLEEYSIDTTIRLGN